jgi:A/G-specific adenine glycosylase
MSRATKAAAKPARDFALRVVAWQRLHGRHGLPWQGTRDAYRIWLSEIMLQQTQVSTVLRYYGRFLERFPTVLHLAQAEQDEVLAMWSGLGYYSRARNLHACAQAVQQRHGGIFPTDAAVLESLPGIGRSTAAAVAAFASAQRVAILDGNVKRVLARHRAFDQDVAKPAGLKALWAVAEGLLPEGPDIEPYTQGLMDLGATVCTLRRPKCQACPLQVDCRAHALGQSQAYPVKTRQRARGTRSSVLLLALRRVRGAGRSGSDGPACLANVAQTGAGVQVLLQRRPSSGIWGGLWTLPLFDDEPTLIQTLAESGLMELGAAEPQGPAGLQPLPTVQHALTHLDWALQPRRLLVAAAAARQPLPKGWVWMELSTALASGLPAPIRLLLEAERQAGA